jgi:transcription elongation factor Elf1
MSMFDSSGNLILPRGAIEAIGRYRKDQRGRRKTGIFVTCPRCGHRWERMSKKGTARCFVCKKRFSLEDLK